jgi:hypothetical protein
VAVLVRQEECRAYQIKYCFGKIRECPGCAGSTFRAILQSDLSPVERGFLPNEIESKSNTFSPISVLLREETYRISLPSHNQVFPGFAGIRERFDFTTVCGYKSGYAKEIWENDFLPEACGEKWEDFGAHLFRVTLDCDPPGEFSWHPSEVNQISLRDPLTDPE